MRCLPLLLLVPALFAATPEETVEQAKQYFEGGRQAYDSGQFAAAALAFSEAYALAPRPAIIFSWAQALRKQYFLDHDQASLKESIRLYRQYLAEVKTGGRREDASGNLAELESLLARATPDASPRAPVVQLTQVMVLSPTKNSSASIDGMALATVPVVREVKPGPHRVRVEAPGYFPREQDFLAVDGRLIVTEVELQPRPGLVRISAPDGADVSVDGKLVGVAPIEQPVELGAGPHRVSATLIGHHPYSEELELRLGQEISVAASLEETTQRKVSYGFISAAGAALLVAGLETLASGAAGREARGLLEIKTVQHKSLTEVEAANYRRARQMSIDLGNGAAALYVGSLSLALTSALLYFIDSPRLAPAKGTHVMVPVGSRDYVGIGLSHGF